MTRSLPYAVGGLCFAVYVALMAPGLTWYDGGELALAAGTMGVAHPPGEPAWSSVAALAALIPLGSLPFRLAVLAAATVAAASGLLTAVVGRVTRRWWGEPSPLAMAVAGLCFGLGSAAVHQSTRVELYGMVALLGALSLWLLERGGRRGVAWAVLPLAVAGAVHHAMLVAALPGFVLLALGRGRGSLRAGLVTAAAFVVPALGQFLWLPLRSWADTAIDFGHPADLQRTLWSVLARGYARSFHPVAGQVGENLLAHGRMLRLDLGDLGLLLAAVGLVVALVGRRRGALAALVLVAVGVLPTVLQGVFRDDNPDARGYLLGPWAVACVGAGLGAAWAVRVLGRWLRSAPWVGSALLLLLVGPVLAQSVAASNRSDVEGPARLGAALLDEAPPGALVLPAGDSWAFPPLYLRYWAGRRSDLTVLPLHMLELPSLDALRRRGAPLPELSAEARARVDAADRSLVGEAILGELLLLAGPPIVLNDVALPSAMLRSRLPLALLYRLPRAGVAPEAFDPSLEEELWTRTVEPLSLTRGFDRDDVAQGALSRRYVARAGWLRSHGLGREAGVALRRASQLARDPWDTAHLWRHRFEQGLDPIGPQPALDARATAALDLLFDGRSEEAGEAVRALLSEAPAQPWGQLAAERLYSLGVQASPELRPP